MSAPTAPAERPAGLQFPLHAPAASADPPGAKSRLPVIASDAVGAAAGGLVRDEANGLVVPAGEPLALAHALRRLAGDAELRARMGSAGAADVRAFSHEAWAEGFARALRTVGAARGRW